MDQMNGSDAITVTKVVFPYLGPADKVVGKGADIYYLTPTGESIDWALGLPHILKDSPNSAEDLEALEQELGLQRQDVYDIDGMIIPAVREVFPVGDYETHSHYQAGQPYNLYGLAHSYGVKDLYSGIPPEIQLPVRHEDARFERLGDADRERFAEIYSPGIMSMDPDTFESAPRTDGPGTSGQALAEMLDNAPQAESRDPSPRGKNVYVISAAKLKQAQQRPAPQG